MFALLMAAFSEADHGGETWCQHLRISEAVMRQVLPQYPAEQIED